MDAAAKDAGEIASAAGSPSTEAAVNKMETWHGSTRKHMHALKDIPSLLTKFKALFRPGVGTFTGTAASIHVPEGAKPRPLPFALKDGVTQELQRLQRQEILVPVKSSDLEYLSQVVSMAGLAPAPCKDEAVFKAPKPQNKKELQSYLGVITSTGASCQTFRRIYNRYRQCRKPVLSQVVKAVSRGEELAEQTYSHKAAEVSLKQRCLLWGSRVMILQSLRSRVVQLLHAGHPGVGKTKMVTRSHVWWPGLDQDIPRMVQSCQVVFGGPFNGHYFLVTVDAFSNEEYLAWLTKNRIRRMIIPPYYPASNGAAERVVQTVKVKLKKSKAGDFRTQVARVLFQYRNTAHDVTGLLQSTALLKHLKQKLAADPGCRPGLLPESGAPVFTRNFQPGPRWLAGHVVSPARVSSLLVRMSDGTTLHRHADDVRPHLATSTAPSGSQLEGEPAKPTAANSTRGWCYACLCDATCKSRASWKVD
ncbi:uncharacterized protein LOC144160733 [Haemaphysalis longicornis]